MTKIVEEVPWIVKLFVWAPIDDEICLKGAPWIVKLLLGAPIDDDFEMKFRNEDELYSRAGYIGMVLFRINPEFRFLANLWWKKRIIIQNFSSFFIF